MESAPKTIFSGIQPSGNLHLGNYLGAIKNWVKFQNNYNCIFCVVDMHAITVPQEPAVLTKKTLEIAKIYLAAGIDPKKSTIFVQSHLPQHSELMWILNTITKTGELFKMTQFKDKAKLENNVLKKSIDAGLLNYPILMAADILLYDTDIVPVGEDQAQHVELCRDLAKRFNHLFGETFKVPQAYIKKEGKRIMGLDNPTKKMSKSAPSKYNRIELTDSPDTIREKIKKAVTDSGSEIAYSDEKPALKNLINIFSSVTEEKASAIEKRFQGKGYKEFKEELAQAIIDFLAPFQKKFFEISDSEVEFHLKEGAKKLFPIAQKKIDQVKERVGFLPAQKS